MADTSIFSDTVELVENLRKNVDGEVRFDKMTQSLYSTDASIYRIEPVGVVIPRNEEDVIAVVEFANSHQVPLLPRGGGTSLAGQTVGNAIVVDFSKYMRSLLECNVEDGWVRVQPGIVLDELNNLITSTGYHFAPDPSTSNRASVGGALGNNSCGAHSVMWGKTVDNTLEMRAVLSNGDIASWGSVSRNTISEKICSNTLEASIYRSLELVGKSTREEIEDRYPKIMRRVSGYNLDELVVDKEFNMARFVVGSEGTLATITEAKLRIVPKPKHKAIAVLHFDDMFKSMEAVVEILDLDLAAVELIDNLIIRQARTNLQYSRIMDFIQGDPQALLLAEVFGESELEIKSKLDKIEQTMSRTGLGYAATRLVNSEEQNRAWAMRKAGLGLMMNVRGAAKPLPFVEDTAVPPSRLPEYVRRFSSIVSDHGTSAGYYGHASVGCLHIRPLIDLKSDGGVDRMLSISSAISDLVLEFGGAMSGEHGDGLVRSVWNQKMFGPVIYDAFTKVKDAFDPKGIMNPGKIVNSTNINDNLKFSPSYKTRNLITGFSYRNEGSFAEATEMCNGQGACRKVSSGTMCPSFMVTRDEEHSTRGRANALNAAVSGILPPESLESERLYEVMDLCVECKACKAECPSNVDVAKLKYEFLDRYHSKNGYSLRNYIFANISRLSTMGSFFAPVSNWLLEDSSIKNILQRIGGIDSRRTLPRFADQTFMQWFKSRGESRHTIDIVGEVVLLVDTFTNYNHPDIGIAAVKILEYLGYKVVVPNIRCCGRPMLSSGMIDKARSNAKYNVDIISTHVEKGAKLVGLEPSCLSSFQDDYLDLLEDHEKVQIVSESSMLIEEFVLHVINESGVVPKWNGGGRKILMQGHCHQKALVGMDKAKQVLSYVPELAVEELESGCCGMAGSFGFEKEHYDVSMKMGELALFPSIRSQVEPVEVVSEGVSCRQQIYDGTGVKAKHLAEILAEVID
tara:strand:- start:5869 stop:8769 length:2901 start_codon:yes stop_codon:yes gene_type:complete